MQVVIVVIVLCSLLSCLRCYFLSFRAQSPRDYSDTNPVFAPHKHLNGEILMEGVMFGAAGRVSNRFVARMVGKWDGSDGTLTEYFTYSDGATRDRRWQFRVGPGNRITATASDIVGVAAGVMSGASLRLKYKIITNSRFGVHSLSVTDWMYVTENGTIINRSEQRKFGIKVGEVIATMRLD